MISRRALFCIVAVAVMGLALSSTVLGLTNEDLRRYGFGTELTDAMNSAREVQTPRRVFNDEQIPEPRLPSLEQSSVPEAPLLRQRVFRQGGAVVVPAAEGPTESLRHGKADRIEGGFKEVQDFFFRPNKEYRPLLTLAEKGVTGLWQTVSAHIQRKGTTWLRAGLSLGRYNLSWGKYLGTNQRIDRIAAPITYMTVPMENLETSLQLDLVNEKGSNFPLPLPTDWETTGIEDVQIMGKYRFMDNKSRKVSAAFGLGLRIGVEDGVVSRRGSNGVDYETFISVTKGIKNFDLTLQGGFIFPNGEDRTNSGVPEISYGNLGFDFRPSEKLDVGLELNYFDWQSAGYAAEATFGLKYRVSRRWFLDLAVPYAFDNKLAVGTRNRGLLSFQVQL